MCYICSAFHTALPTPAFSTLAFLTVSHFPLPHFQSPRGDDASQWKRPKFHPRHAKTH